MNWKVRNITIGYVEAILRCAQRWDISVIKSFLNRRTHEDVISMMERWKETYTGFDYSVDYTAGMKRYTVCDNDNPLYSKPTFCNELVYDTLLNKSLLVL